MAAVAGYALRRPRVVGTLLGWYAGALVRRPVAALKHVVAALCWARSSEQLLAGRRPDVVHAFDWPWTHGAAAVLVARRLGARSLLSTFGELVPHDSEVERLDASGRPFVGTVRRILASADLVASMTDHCRRQTRDVGFPSERVRLLRVLGDMEPFRAVAGLSRAGKRLLFVGQLRERKGPQVLLEALPAILGRHPEASVTFVGPDHGLAPALAVRADELGVSGAVRFTGAVADDDLPGFYGHADVFVFPTTTPIECLGLTFVQAMFAGTPVVATRIAAAPEIIRPGVDGYLVEPGDSRELAERVADFLDLPEGRRMEIAESARTRIAELYDEHAVVDDAADTYRELAGG